MELEDIYRDKLRKLEDGKSELETKLARVDQCVENIRSVDPNDPTLRVIERGRAPEQDELERFEKEIERVKNLIAHNPIPENGGARPLLNGFRMLKDGEFKDMRPLTAAVKAYLTIFCPDRPIPLATLTEILNRGGVQVQDRRNKGIRKPVLAKHLAQMAFKHGVRLTDMRKMLADHKTGFKARGLQPPFVYDAVRGTIELNRAQDVIDADHVTA
jgi:hypothetical protein